MTGIDLDVAKQTWPSGVDASRDRAQARQLEDCLGSSAFGAGRWLPVGLDDRLRRAAAIDLLLKAALLLALILAFASFDASVEYPLLFTALGVGLVAGLAAQWVLYSKVPHIDPGRLTMLETHRRMVGYYASYGRLSTFVHASTSPLFFLVGSSIYLFTRYGNLPALDRIDWIVFGSGSVMALLLGWVPLRIVQERQRRHLVANLAELERDALDPARIERHRRGGRRLRIVLAMLSFAGAAVFLLLLLFGRTA